jgi:hypothetical protein
MMHAGYLHAITDNRPAQKRRQANIADVCGFGRCFRLRDEGPLRADLKIGSGSVAQFRSGGKQSFAQRVVLARIKCFEDWRFVPTRKVA